MEDIDPLITQLEQSYSNGNHLVKVMGFDCLSEFSSCGIETWEYIFGGDSEEEFDKRLKEVAYGIEPSLREHFLRMCATAVRLMFILSDGELDEEEMPNAAKKLLESNDFEVEENSLAFHVLVSKLTTSKQLQFEMLRSVLDDDPIGERELTQLIPRPSTAVFSEPKEETPEHGPLFSEVYQEFLEHKVTKESLTVKNQQYYEQYYMVWSLIAEDKPIEQYTPKDIGKFIDRCFELPKMNINPYKNMSWQERAEVDVPDEHIVSPKTAQQYYKWLQSVFAYAKRDTIGYISTSPCSIKRDFKARVRGVYDSAELNQFITQAQSPDKPWQRWVILLGIYTGARRGEIAQLRKADIKYHEATKRYYILERLDLCGMKSKQQLGRL